MLVGGEDGFEYHIWVSPYCCEYGVVVDELYIISIVSNNWCRNGDVHIQRYKCNALRTALDWHSNEVLPALGLGGHHADRIIVCKSVTQSVYGSRIHIG